MARLSIRQKNILISQLQMMDNLFNLLLFLALALLVRRKMRGFRKTITYADQRLYRQNISSLNLNRMVFDNDVQCVENYRMDRRALGKLCYLLKTHGKLKDNKNMTVEDMVVSFLHIIAHNVKNRVLKRQIAWSSDTISRQFHSVLNSILRLHDIMLRKPEPIPDNSTDDRWKWFKVCILIEYNMFLSSQNQTNY